MVELHSHSLLSDGALLPCELARRAEEKGFLYIALTDHVDMVCVERIAGEAAENARALSGHARIKIIPGVEITHVPPDLIADAVARARRAGANLVLVHGETPVEPVCPGTNRAAVDSGADILAHPGLIDADTARIAAANGVLLEISGRRGHSLANGHVARAGVESGAGLVFGSDAHEPGDIAERGFAEKVLAGAGLDAVGVRAALENMRRKAEESGKKGF